MSEELSGLKIDLCCVFCKSLPTGDLPLFEMQNRFFICGRCLLQQEQQGKTLKGKDGALITLIPSIRTSLESPAQVKETQTTLVDDTIFGFLEISFDATEDEGIEAIDRKMRYWITQPRSKERERMRERLADLREEVINNPHFLSEQRPQQEIIALPTIAINGKEVSSFNDFVALCERSEAGWLDGEKHLRERDLEYWVFALAKNDMLDKRISAARKIPSTFCALNEVLYLLAPERPFRLYQQDRWQALATIESTSTTMQLISLCDLSWPIVMHHLYAGSLLTWLEFVQSDTELSVWYSTAIANYAWKGYIYQSLGLELLLEKIAPDLSKPELSITFDGRNNAYTVSEWDSEIAHRPILVTIHNQTRGAALFTLTLEPLQSNADIVAFQHNPSDPFYIRPGEQNPVIVSLLVNNLKQLNYGKRYKCILHLVQYNTMSQLPIQHKYPITLEAMAYRQGFRRYLWLWGLRGGFPALLLNAIAGTVSGVTTLFALNILNHISPVHDPFLNNIIQALIIGTHDITTKVLGTTRFVLIAGAIVGLIGSFIGLKTGHTDYLASHNMRNFTRAGGICMFLFFSGLLFWSWNYPFPGSHPLLADTGWLRFVQVGGSFLISLLLLICISLLSLIRSLVEQLLRRRYRSLLTPQGS